MPPRDLSRAERIGQYLTYLLMWAPMRAALALPYETRVRVAGWFVARVAGPLVGYPRRVRRNLAHAWPDLPRAEAKRLETAAPDNSGRTMIELLSPEFPDRAWHLPSEGPGLAAFEQAVAARRPVVLISGHFGNYDVARAHIARRYGPIGGLFRPLNNVFFHRRYIAAMAHNATPLFARDRRGMAQMLKFLRQGNIVAILVDQYFRDGAELTFFGKPARTALSAAEMALKYDALFLPAFVIRQPDGISFRMEYKDPIPHSDAATMMQAANDVIEEMVRAHPEQWLWIHRRWK